MYICYNDALKIAPQCRNMLELIHVLNGESQSSCCGYHDSRQYGTVNVVDIITVDSMLL